MPFAIRHFAELPKNPVLLIALEGWIDAGQAAATASAAIMESIDSETFATFAVDDLIDLRSRRPQQIISNGVRGGLEWAEPELLVGKDKDGVGIAMLVGPEPDYKWKAFAAEIVEFAVEMGVRLVVNLGGFPAATPHTRPIRLAATASDDDLAQQIGFVPGSLDVPAGIADVIGDECAVVGIPSIGLWARVPHYVANMPFAPAALALVEGFASIANLSIDVAPLKTASDDSRRLVDELISQSEENIEMVQQLETQVEEVDIRKGGIVTSLPSGDEIAAELEKFLRGETGTS